MTELQQMRCSVCGQRLQEAADRGAYLKRISPDGENPPIWQCEPDCQGHHGSGADAVMRAFKDGGLGFAARQEHEHDADH